MEEPVDEKSHIRCNIIIEVLGKPKEHVVKALDAYVDKISQDSELIVMNKKLAEPEEKEKELWATFVELDLVVKGLRKLVAFCFDYMPSSVQIVKPSNFALNREVVEDFINDLQARLHQVDMIVKQTRNENVFLKKNMDSALSNIVLVALSKGRMNKETIMTLTGIHDKELQIILDDLMGQKKVQEVDSLYTLTQDAEKQA